MATCPVDGATFEPSTPRHRYCSPKCRQAASRTRARARTAPVTAGANLTAARATVAAIGTRLEPVDEARVTAFLTIAQTVDQDPHNASLWLRYLQAERAVREVAPDGETNFDRLRSRLQVARGAA